MSLTLILIVIGAAIVVVGGMTASFYILNQREIKKRRLQLISGLTEATDKEKAKNNADKRRADLAKKLQQSEGEKTRKKEVLIDLIRQAGWAGISGKQFWLLSFALGFLLFLIVKLTGQSLPVSILCFIIGAFGLPRFVLRFCIRRRQKKFLEEFPDALESMVRLLKAGMPVGEAIAMVSREFTGPVGEEMSKVYDEQKIGIPMAEACLHAAERMPITEMQMFATGIAIQQQTGSSLSEILTNLARVIRARFRLKRKVQALSAEAKASAMIIGSLPILVGAGLSLINPDYMDPLFNTLKGKFYLGGAIAWMAIGVLVMKQMINFKV